MQEGLSESIFRQGRRRLQTLLPWAKAEARRAPAEVIQTSSLAAALAPYVTEANCDSLVVYRAPLGGWHADLIFKHVPPAIPNTMGSPVGNPLKTEAEAEEFAKRLLVMMLTAADRTPPASDPVFLLYGQAVRLIPQELGETPGYASFDAAIDRIEDILSLLFPEGYTPERCAALSIEDTALLWGVLHMAALTGVYAYPARMPAPPS